MRKAAIHSSLAHRTGATHKHSKSKLNYTSPVLSCPFIADYSSSLYRNDPSLAVSRPHVYQQSNISAVLSERIQSCIVPFPSSGIRTNDPILPGTKRSGRTGGEDCGKRDGRGIISGMTSVLNHSRLALSARVSERQFSKCHLSLPPTHTNQRGLAHTQTHIKTTGPDLRNLPAIPLQSHMANGHLQAEH